MMTFTSLTGYSWDMAKFEVCSHKWADLSEYGYGVSILNDSKYGFATVGNVMRLSLLRSSKAPDGHADMGRHHFRYAILPHSGTLDYRTIRAGYNFNQPLTPVSVAGTAARNLIESKNIHKAVYLTGSKSLVLDTVKRGEDDEDVSRGDLPKRNGRSVILRIYESLGGKSRGSIKTDLPVKRVWKTNILEDDEAEFPISYEELTGDLKSVDIELRPFEIATFRLQL